MSSCGKPIISAAPPPVHFSLHIPFQSSTPRFLTFPTPFRAWDPHNSSGGDLCLISFVNLLHYLVSSTLPPHFVNKIPLLLAMLCTLCARLSFYFWEELSLNDQKIARKYRLSNKHNYPPGSTVNACRYFIHQRRVSTLKETAEVGCHFCALLWHSLFELPRHCTDCENFGIDWRSYQNQALVFRLELYREGPWVEQLDSKWCDGTVDVFCGDLAPVFLRLTKSLSGTCRQPGK